MHDSPTKQQIIRFHLLYENYFYLITHLQHKKLNHPQLAKLMCVVSDFTIQESAVLWNFTVLFYKVLKCGKKVE